MEKLKAIRTGNKAAITRSINLLLKEENMDPVNRLKLYEGILKKRKVLEKLDEEILEAIPAEDTESEIVNSDEYYTTLDRELTEIETRFKLNVSVSQSHSQLTSSELNPRATEFQMPFIPAPAQSTSSFGSQNHKLPKLSLPKFNGDILEWQTFWDSLETTVHFNHTLTDIQKFSYLKSLLEYSASNVIAGLALTNTNYQKAIALLTERYGQKHKIINAYMKSLLDLPAPQSNLSSLREFYDTAESYIRGLESLGQQEETFGTMLIPILMDKLPSNVKINITRANGSDRWTLESLRQCILHEITILEAGSVDSSLNSVLPTSNFPRSTRSSKQKFNNKSTQFQRDPKKCVYCKENHFTGDCPLDYDKRLGIVKEHRLCFNCLGHHQVSKCQSKGTCRNCHKKHHTSLCKMNDKSSKVAGTAQKSTDISVESSIIQESPQSQTIDDKSVLHSTSTSVTLLKTAVATVSSSPRANSFTSTNILFDEGAQRSFITEELANDLKVKVSGTESLKIAAFGDETAKSIRHLNKTTIYVEAESGEKVPVKVLIVPNIAAPIHTNRVAVNSYPYLKGLKLAHPVNSGNSFNVSLLIGADFYWSFVGDEIIRGDGPTAVSSKLGYLISGPTDISTCATSNPQTSLHNVLTFHRNEEVNIARFWEVEDIEPKAGLLREQAESYGRHSISFQNGHYSAKLPWRGNCEELPTNEEIARRRTENVIKRLARDGEMLETYSKIIQDQEARGFIEKVDISQDTNSIKKHYIPHHPVAKDSSTTPVRIVYDCSCRTNRESPSLNDCLDSKISDRNFIALQSKTVCRHNRH